MCRYVTRTEQSVENPEMLSALMRDVRREGENHDMCVGKTSYLKILEMGSTVQINRVGQKETIVVD